MWKQKIELFATLFFFSLNLELYSIYETRHTGVQQSRRRNQASFDHSFREEGNWGEEYKSDDFPYVGARTTLGSRGRPLVYFAMDKYLMRILIKSLSWGVVTVAIFRKFRVSWEGGQGKWCRKEEGWSLPETLAAHEICEAKTRWWRQSSDLRLGWRCGWRWCYSN